MIQRAPEFWASEVSKWSPIPMPNVFYSRDVDYNVDILLDEATEAISAKKKSGLSVAPGSR